MLNFLKKTPKENIIMRDNIKASISDLSEESTSNNNTINLKMRKINKKHNTQNNSNAEKIRQELIKLLGDLRGKKFNQISKDKLLKEAKLKKIKLTPYQKMLKVNEKTKKALSIKKHLLFNPQNLEFFLKLRSLKKIKKKNFINKTERSLYSNNQSFFETNKNNNNSNSNSHYNIHNKILYNNNTFVKTIRIPTSRNSKQFKVNKNNDKINMNLFNTDKSPININNNLIIHRNKRHNILLINEKQLLECDITKGEKKKFNSNKNIFIDEKKYSKTYSKMSFKNNSVIKRNNDLPVNKYIDTHKKKAFKEAIKPLNFITNNNNSNYYLTNNEKSKKIIINKKNANRTYNSFLINKTLYNNGNFGNKII